MYRTFEVFCGTRRAGVGLGGEAWTGRTRRAGRRGPGGHGVQEGGTRRGGVDRTDITSRRCGVVGTGR